MKFLVNFEYEEQYLPTPRCRKLRTRMTNGQTEVIVREVTKEEAPIACIVHDGFDFSGEPMANGHYPKKVYDVRLFDGQMYKRPLCREWRCGGEGYATTEQLAERLDWGVRGASCWGYENSYDGKSKAARDDADNYLIIDGEVWQKCGEPMYLVMTFGLGHNHGGTSGFIEHFYNNNISKDNYFNAKDREKAVAYGKEVAQQRGDTKYIDGIFKDRFIDVKIPEAFKADPQKEHGNGDPFLNALESIINNSDTQSEAAFGVIAATVKQVAG